MPNIRYAVAGSAAALLLSACGSSSTTASPATAPASGAGGGTFHVLAILPLSGALADYGSAEKSALQAAADVINASGGVNGATVSISAQDDAGTSTQTVSVLNAALASGTKPDMVFPGITSDEALAALPILTQNKILVSTVASSSAVNDSSKYPYTFTDSVTPPFRSAAALSRVVSKGLKKIAVLVPNSAVGKALQPAIQSYAAGNGLSVTKIVSVDTTSLDPTPELQQLQATSPDALVVAGLNGPIGAAVMKARGKIGWTIPTFLDDVSSDNDLSGVAASLLGNVTLTVSTYAITGNAKLSTPGYVKYSAALAKYEKKFVFTPDVYAQPYSALIAAAAAVTKAKSPDIDKIRTAFESLTAADSPLWFMTASFGFSATNHAVAYDPKDFDYLPGTAVRGANGLFPKAAG